MGEPPKPLTTEQLVARALVWKLCVELKKQRDEAAACLLELMEKIRGAIDDGKLTDAGFDWPRYQKAVDDA